MDAFWIPLLTILALLRPTDSASNTTEVIGAVGGSVTFRSLSTNPNPAFWNFGNEPIAAVAFEDPPRPLFYQDKFKTHFAVSEKGRAVTISQLSMEDAGTYSVTIDGIKTSTFTLRVYRELAEPTVTCESQNCSSGHCLLSLRCSMPGSGFGNVFYNWTLRGQPWDEGPVVLVEVKSPRDEPEPLTCTARNDISSRSVTVTDPGVKCSEIFTHPPSPTHPPGPDHLGSSGRIGIIAGAAAVIGVLLVFLLFFCKPRGWRKFRLSEPEPTDTVTTAEYTTVYAEVGPSQQRVPNGLKAKPVREEPSSTIYSLVKRPEQAADGAAADTTAAGLELV